MMTELSQIISQIEPLNPAWLDQARERLDSLTKPRGSLGRLEELAALYVGIRGELLPSLDKKWVVVFAADHGVVAEGVSAYPQEVTHQMVLNFLRGGAGINALARHAGARVAVVDIGVNHDFGHIPELIDRKVAYGSRNMAQEPALTREEALQALLVGVEMAEQATATGVDALAAGDMGIGNTTPAAALASVFTGKPVAAAAASCSPGAAAVPAGAPASAACTEVLGVAGPRAVRATAAPPAASVAGPVGTSGGTSARPTDGADPATDAASPGAASTAGAEEPLAAASAADARPTTAPSAASA